MRYELLVGLRYTRAKRRNHFISFISATSMAGIALGVAALIVVLSVMNGFQKELRARILGVASHVQLSGDGNRLDDWPALQDLELRRIVVRRLPRLGAHRGPPASRTGARDRCGGRRRSASCPHRDPSAT